jgi:Fe2+ transport system protein B
MEQDIYNRIGKLEDSITEVKVELAQTYKDLINHHKMDEVNSKHYKEELAAIKEATRDKNADKSRLDKWVGEVLTPQTIAIILAILAAVMGAQI